VTVDTSNGLPYAAWLDSKAPAGYVGTYYYNGSRYNTYTSASAGANASANAATDSREVTISCPTIDTPASYSKGAVDSQHPTGQWPHIRNGDGSMIVDSVVTRSGGQYAVSTSTLGDTFIGQATNFSHPYYTWGFAGPDGNVGTYSQQYLGVESDQYATLLLQLYFGTSGTGYPKTSALNLTVRDGLDNATAANTYTVHWHLPVENWMLISSVQATNRIYPSLGADADGATSIEPNRTIFYTIPSQEIDVAGPAVKTLSVFLAGAGAAAPALLPEAIATGPIGIATVSLLAAGSATAAFLVPPDPGHDTGHTNYVDYVFAVNQQQIINNGGTGIQRFNPALVNQALANFAVLQSKYGAD
jgi:hypothetical protein